MAEITRANLGQAVVWNMFPHKYMVPHGGQVKAINAIGSGVFVVLITAANGWGKTYWGAYTVANISCKSKSPHYKKFKTFTDWPYPKLGRLVSSPDNISDVGAVTKALEYWLPGEPGNGWSRSKGNKSFYSNYKFDTGHSFKVLSVEQEKKEFESDTLGWAWFDEPPLYEQYIATVWRMRKGGIIFITATPLSGCAWMKDEIADKADGIKKFWIEGDIEDNCIEHGENGYLKHSDIQRMSDECDEDERAARMHGKFMYLSGLVFKSFDRDIHVIGQDDIQNLWPTNLFGEFDQWPAINICDPHDRRSDVHIYAKITPNNDLIIYDEYPDWNFHEEKSRKHSIKETVKELHKKESGQTIKEICVLLRGQQTVVRRVMDKRKGKQMQSGPALNTFDLYLHAGSEMGWNYNYEESPKVGLKNVDHKTVKEYLAWNKNLPLNIKNKPKMFVVRDCKNTVYDFEHYLWDDFTGKAKDSHDLKEVPKDLAKDHMDCCRWLCELKPQFKDYKSQIRPRDKYRQETFNTQQNINRVVQEDDWML